MNKTFSILVVFVVSLLILGGCRSNPVMNIDNAAIAIDQQYTEEDVKKAIIRAGQSLGWNIQDKAPGRLVGKLYLRSHIAIIDIRYDKAKYSINYKDSTNLDYDGVNIHSNYNGWIERLNQHILVQLSNL